MNVGALVVVCSVLAASVWSFIAWSLLAGARD
jgi:hypothetical protein